jgi:hypothetical protein
LLQSPGWLDGLIGQPKDFPELAEALGVEDAVISHAVAYRGQLAAAENELGMMIPLPRDMWNTCIYRVL